MNYPIWDLPAAGLLIAAVAILHVFISHFAIGGGLFLVFYEWKARREKDRELLAYVKRHSRFFLLLTLILGALTGVGIWFTIGLVHPQATSTLIQNFVWVWAIEWTFFVTEIAAAMVYYYGWEKLRPHTHLIVGWIYFVSAWMSLVVINGILTFMLTPGEWITNRSLWDGFMNPSYWPSLVSRTLIAIGLAGVYALLTASLWEGGDLKRRIARYAAIRWVVPAAVLLPFSLSWYLSSVSSAGVRVADFFGSPNDTLLSILGSVISNTTSSGYPLAQSAAFWAVLASAFVAVGALLIILWPNRLLTPSVTLPILALGMISFGGAEWVREALRKPYVLYNYMFVNGVRLPAPAVVLESYPGVTALHDDPFSIGNLNEAGLLKSAIWFEKLDSRRANEESRIEEGKRVFKLLCFSCHTATGHLAIKPLVAGRPPSALEETIRQLARPISGSDWNDPDLQLVTWRNRRMPPFAGSDEELGSLALYLDSLDGNQDTAAEVSSLGEEVFEQKCVFCHGPEAAWPMRRIAAGLNTETFYERIGKLPELNPAMPDFTGTEEERRALAVYLSDLVSSEEMK